MTETKYWRAVNLALHDAMEADDRVLVIGQDVGVPGGPYGLTRRLLDTYGRTRVRDTPISEAAIVATGVGAAMTGLRPVVEVMFLDFIGLGLDQLLNQAAKYPFFTQGRLHVPLVINTLYGGRANMGAQHSQSLEAWLCHIPGLKVAFPSNPADAYATLRAAINDPGPVVVIHSISLLQATGTLSEDGAGASPGTGRIVQSGSSCTVVSYGPALRICAAAAADLDVELIDLRWLSPWPRELVLNSVAKTSRLLVVHDAPEAGGWGAEVVATVASEGLWHLDAPPRRLGALAQPLPVARTQWEPLLPSRSSVREAVQALLRF
jgi:pyruvate/2-oxoglutarate/acetoin dehydrogenase E1 component